MLFILILLALVGSGLMAGLFFAFSTFIMRALGKRPASVGIAAMQSINETILNPIFFTVFFGTAVLSAALAVLAVVHWGQAESMWFLAGAILYLAGSIGITMLGNVPLNNALAKVAPDSDEGPALWNRYRTNWTGYNHVRTIACLGAMICFVLALI